MSRRRSSAHLTPAPPPTPEILTRAETARLSAAAPEDGELTVLDGPVGEVAYSRSHFERLGLAIARLDELGELRPDPMRLDALRAQISNRLAQRRARAQGKQS
jgi:hypothetical protein